jgi:hypothetical protein
MNINFAFVRHGYGCHNSMSNLAENNVISFENAQKFLQNIDKPVIDIRPLNDPVLTEIGLEASIYNGVIINKILKQLSNITSDEKLQMDKFDIVGCSPLIRSMETAYYMTQKWNNPPQKIYVFPLLREIDESSDNKYSEQSRQKIDIKPSYNMKTIGEQKAYLRKIGILDVFDFSFVESYAEERKEPGDIKKFINWFGENFIKRELDSLNVFIITHAGVMKDFSKDKFYNNSGFVINTTLKNKLINVNKYISLNNFLQSYHFFKDYYKYNKLAYYCPSQRCDQLCSVVNYIPFRKSVKRLPLRENP